MPSPKKTTSTTKKPSTPKQGNNRTKTGAKQVLGRDAKGRFASGSSGNPNGRPEKEHSITATIRAMFDKDPQIKQKLAKVILQQAETGDLAAVKLLWQYIDGMPTQNVKGEHEVNSNLSLTDEQLDRILKK